MEDLAFAELSGLPVEAPVRRDSCQRCRRPTPVCVCSCFPAVRLPIQTRIIVLQHPNEESRPLATVPLMRECIAEDRCHVIKGKHFGPGKSELLNEALASPNSLLLYPGKTAVDIGSVPQKPIGCHDSAALIVIDGTWAQAKGIFTQNPQLHQVRQIQLNAESMSEYVVRTQPTRGCLSTLESVAHALAWLEERPDIVETLVCPLRALCQYQLNHGAVVHHSRDNPDHVPRRLKLQQKLELRSSVTEDRDKSSNCQTAVD